MEVMAELLISAMKGLGNFFAKPLETRQQIIMG